MKEGIVPSNSNNSDNRPVSHEEAKNIEEAQAEQILRIPIQEVIAAAN